MTNSATSSPPRVAIVTGGSGGIGRVVCERLAADGMSVLVHYAGNPARAEEVVKAITSAGGAAAAQADVADESEVSALFDEAEQQFGGVDVVVHTAGIQFLAPLAELKLDDLDRMHRTNIRGTFVVGTRHSGPATIKLDGLHPPALAVASFVSFDRGCSWVLAVLGRRDWRFVFVGFDRSLA